MNDDQFRRSGKAHSDTSFAILECWSFYGWRCGSWKLIFAVFFSLIVGLAVTAPLASQWLARLI